MRRTIKKLSFIVYYLVGILVLGPSGNALAKVAEKQLNPKLADVEESNPSNSKAAAETSNPHNGKQMKISVVGLEDGKIKSSSVRKVADTLRDQLKSESKFIVLSKEETESFLNKQGSTLDNLETQNPYLRYLDEAKEFYKNASLKEAGQLLENTIWSYRETPVFQGSHFPLIEAYKMLGNVYYNSKNTKKTEEVFQETVRLDPQTELDPMMYAPPVVQRYQQIRKDYLSKVRSSELMIESNPSGAQVYVNGVKRGETPLRLEKVTPGDQFVSIEKPEYQSQIRRFEVGSKAQKEKFELVKIAEKKLENGSLQLTNLDDVSEQVRLGSAIGKKMGLEKVVLVSVQELGWNHKITARMIDVKYQASHKHKSVEVLDLAQDTRPASGVIAQELSLMADLDLAKNPKKYAESDVVVIGKKKKSLWRSPVLWTLLGVVAAGGATSAALLSTKGKGGAEEDPGTAISGGGIQAKK